MEDYFKAVEREIAERKAAAEKARADKATDQQRRLALLTANESAEVVATMKRITNGKTIEENRFRFIDASVLLGTAVMKVEQIRDEYREPEYRAEFRAFPSFDSDLTSEAGFLPVLQDDVLRWKTRSLGAENEQSSAELAVSLLKALCEFYKALAIDALAKSERKDGL